MPVYLTIVLFSFIFAQVKYYGVPLYEEAKDLQNVLCDV